MKFMKFIPCFGRAFTKRKSSFDSGISYDIEQKIPKKIKLWQKLKSFFSKFGPKKPIMGEEEIRGFYGCIKVLEPLASETRHIFFIPSLPREYFMAEHCLKLNANYKPDFVKYNAHDYANVLLSFVCSGAPFLETGPCRLKELQEHEQKVWTKLIKLFANISLSWGKTEMDPIDLGLILARSMFPDKSNVEEEALFVANLIEDEMKA